MILTVLALSTTPQPAELVPRDANVYGQYIHYAEIGNDIDGSVVRIIDHAGHLPQMEATDAFLEVVRPFLIYTAPTLYENIDPL